MLKKILKIGLVFIILINIYSILVYWSIYYRLGLVDLQSSDNRHRYTFNEQSTTSPEVVYVALGDSFTAGVGVNNYEQSYPYLIAQRMASDSARIVHLNYSYRGAKTIDLINDLLPKAITDQPDIVTLLIGTNDLHDNSNRDDFRRNYETILIQLKTKTSAKINIISLPFSGAPALIWPPFNYYYYLRTLSFNKIIKELAFSNNINYIDLTTPTKPYAFRGKNLSGNDYYATDNFHPSALGYQYWFKVIYDNLNK